MMKKMLLLCAAMIALSMMSVSCSKDTEELIIGKWRIQSTVGMGNTINDGSHDIPEDTVVYEDDWGWVFNSGGKGYSYRISNGEESIGGNLTYHVNSDSLHIKYENNLRMDFGLDKITNRNLRLSAKTELVNSDGRFVKYHTFYMNFRRI